MLEENLASQGVDFEAKENSSSNARHDDSNRIYKVLITDLIGMRFNVDGNPDYSEVKSHIEAKGGAFHVGSQSGANALDAAKFTSFICPL